MGFANKFYLKQREKTLNNHVNETSNTSGESNARSCVDDLESTKPQQVKKLDDHKSAFYDFYLMLLLLKNYQTLNSIGFCKILKKRDKIFQSKRGDEWR